MISELRLRGHEIRVITAYPNYPTGRVFDSYRHRRGWKKEDGFMIRRCWILAATGTGMKRLISYLSFLMSSMLPLISACRRWRPDYVFIESPPLFLGFSGVVVRRFLGVPYIFNVADLWPDWAVDAKALSRDSWTYRWSKSLERLIYSRSAYITIVVENMRKTLQAMGVEDKKILFLPNGAKVVEPGSAGDVVEDPEVEEIKRLCEGKRIVLYAGNHGSFHDLKTLIRGAELCRTRNDVLFLFVGDGTEKRAAIAYVKKLGLTNVEFFRPVTPEVLNRILEFTTVSLASYVRGFKSRSAKMLPAMALGVPVVMSGEGEGSELIERAKAGLAVPPEEPRKLASAVLRLVDDEDLATRLGDNGKRYVGEHLSWGRLVDAWLAELEARQREPV